MLHESKKINEVTTTIKITKPKNSGEKCLDNRDRESMTDELKKQKNKQNHERNEETEEQKERPCRKQGKRHQR